MLYHYLLDSIPCFTFKVVIVIRYCCYLTGVDDYIGPDTGCFDRLHLAGSQSEAKGDF